MVARGPSECVAGADLVVLAGPPLAVLETLGDLPDPLLRADGPTVTDVASTKAAILRQADLGSARFVGGHPMAGSDASGLCGGRPDLFEARPWVVVPGRSASDADVARVEALATTVGAVPVRMTAEAHDAAVAAVSHLPLVVAAALVEAMTGSEDWPAASGVAASGWRDTTRLARGDPEMGAGILATNAAAVVDRLAALRTAIDGWMAALEDPDAAVLRARLAAARAGLEPGREAGG